STRRCRLRHAARSVLFLVLIRPPPRPTLFPYTTLSDLRKRCRRGGGSRRRSGGWRDGQHHHRPDSCERHRRRGSKARHGVAANGRAALRNPEGDLSRHGQARRVPDYARGEVANCALRGRGGSADKGRGAAGCGRCACAIGHAHEEGEVKKRGRGRPASGTVVWAGDHWRIRITLLDGSRPWFDLNPRISEKEARKLAREASELARKEKRVLISPKGEAKEDPGGETVRFWSSRWLDYREERGLESVSDDRARVRDHVLPVIGDIAMADVTEDHIRDVVHSLDEKVGKGELAWKTASNV